MALNFRKLSDKSKIVDLKDYLTNWLIENPKDKILISCDSQNHGKDTEYARVIVLRKKGKGGHVLYDKQTFKRKLFGEESGKDFEKLYKEAQLLDELADYIIENLGRKPDTIVLDYNPDPYFFSNKVLVATLGWLSQKAKKVVGKPSPYVHIADRAVKGFKQYVPFS